VGDRFVNVGLDRLQTNLREVERRIELACSRTGRSDLPRLLVATKYLTVDEMAVLPGAGIRLVGRTGQMS